jgi:hypothetical protein
MIQTNKKLEANLNKLFKFYDKSKENELKSGYKEIGE